MRVAFGDCTFDSERRELCRGEEPVRLAPKAYRLLEILIERRPRAVPQQELYDELWPDTIVDFANLHNLVSQVRAAIGDRDHTAIRTVYGFGFSFAAPAHDAGEAGAGDLSPYALVVEEAVYPLRTGANVVGRSAAADVTVFHPSLSRSHSRIVIAAGAITIEDLRSRNGTFVNEVRVDGVVAVTTRDQIRFGGVTGGIVSDDAETEDVASAAIRRRDARGVDGQ